ncbi:MAG: cytochrome c oxidase assembly accessory protein ScuA [Winogradskyella sp.]
MPILGETTTLNNGDVVYYKTPEFRLTNQSGNSTSSKTFDGKVQVIDFFFTSCPTICPQMTKHLKIIEKEFESESNVEIISFSIDPLHDTPERLKIYSKQYNIDNTKWSFLTSTSSDVLELAKDYKVRAFNDGSFEEPSLLHDGTFILVDQLSRIRGYYNGLDYNDVLKLKNDIKILLNNS